MSETAEVFRYDDKKMRSLSLRHDRTKNEDGETIWVLMAGYAGTKVALSLNDEQINLLVRSIVEERDFRDDD